MGTKKWFWGKPSSSGNFRSEDGNWLLLLIKNGPKQGRYSLCKRNGGFFDPVCDVSGVDEADRVIMYEH